MTNLRSAAAVLILLAALVDGSRAFACEGPFTPEVEPNSPASAAWQHNWYGGCFQPGVWGTVGCFGETVAPVFTGTGQVTTTNADPGDNWIFQSNRVGVSQLSITIGPGNCLSYDVFGCDYQPPFCTTGQPCPLGDPCTSYPVKLSGRVCNASTAGASYSLGTFNRKSPSAIPGVTYFRLRFNGASSASTTVPYVFQLIAQ
jgi:hypothetical protein